jgi:hypothetical protein
VIAPLLRLLRRTGTRIAKPPRRAFAFATLLTLVAFGVWCVQNRTALNATERKLVGSWIGPDSAGRAEAFTFAPHRRITSRVVNRSGATVGKGALGDKDEIWFVDGQTILIRRGRKGQPSLVERVSGNDYLWDKWPIASLTDDTLVIGDENWSQRFVLRREGER